MASLIALFLGAYLGYKVGRQAVWDEIAEGWIENPEGESFIDSQRAVAQDQ